MFEASLQRLFDSAIEQFSDDRIKKELESVLNGTDNIELPEELLQAEHEEDNLTEEKAGSIANLIRSLGMPGKIKLAIHGNSVARAALIRDTNRQIPLFVLENPRLTENEITEFARNSLLDESVLREIARNCQWMKNYSIKLNIISNPKTPVDVSLQWLKHLRDKDLRSLGRSKNVSQLIAVQSRKLLEKRNPTS